MLVRMPISIFDSGTIPHERRAELEVAVVAAGRRLHQRYEGWIVAMPDCRKFAVRIASYPEVDVSVPFDWHTTAAEATERVRVAMEIDAHGSLGRNVGSFRAPSEVIRDPNFSYLSRLP
jgi:hypothetical protein